MGFEEAARAYEILSDPQKRLEREGPFFRQRVQKGMRVLDLACGTGVHAEYLARWGAHVTACDLSPAMIEQARLKRSHPDITYDVRDMRTPPPGPFDFVFCIGNSLNLLPERSDVETTLRAVHKILAPAGRLLLHLINPDAPAHQHSSILTRTGSVDGHPVRVEKYMQPFRDGRIISVRIEDDLGVDEAKRVQYETALLLDIRMETLSDILKRANYSDSEYFGGLDDSPFVLAGSQDIVVVVCK